MWWVTSGRGVEHAGAHEREHAIEVADDVGLAGVQRQRLDPHEAHVHLGALGVDPDDAHRAAVGGHADGEVERARVADRVDGHVDPAPVGGGLDRRARVVLGEVHGRRAEAARHVEPRLDGVDGDDVGGARGARGLDGAQPDGPEAEHGDAVARAHRHGRVVAGAHHVAGEERDVAGHPLRARGAG